MISSDEVVTAWTTALRSGEYKQGIGSLKTMSRFDELSYCCLGVLCDLALKNQWIPGLREDRAGVYAFGYSTPHSDPREATGVTPATVRSLITWLNVAAVGRLIQANDTKRLGFDAIATMIEEFNS